MQRFKNQYRGDKPLFETDFVNGDIVNVVNVKTAICKEVCARPRRGIVSGAYWRAASPSQCLKTHKRHCDGAGIGLIPCAVGVPPTSVFGGFEASRGSLSSTRSKELSATSCFDSLLRHHCS